MKRPSKEAGPTFRCGVYKMRKKGERIGSVEAKDYREALERAYEAFAIPEADRFRVTVHRE